MIDTHQPATSGNVREGDEPPSAAAEEHVLFSERLYIERKRLTVSLRENFRGRFLRITEDVADRHDTIIVPAPGLGEFLRLLAEVARLAARPATRRRRPLGPSDETPSAPVRLRQPAPRVHEV